jgi:DNA-binding GntR family transcriptional regulator
MVRKPSKEKVSLVQVAKQAVENKLLTGSLRSDERLIESELAEQLGISRTPLREALRQLETKGLLKKRNDVGYVVVHHSREDIRNNFEVRVPLEIAAVKLACERATGEHIDRASFYLAQYDADLRRPQKGAVRIDEIINSDRDWNSLFHKVMYEAAGNKLLTEYILNLRELDRLKRISYSFSLEDLRNFQAQHYNILDAVKRRNKNKAEKAVTAHLDTLFNFYCRLP